MDSATRRQRAISAVWIWVSVPTTWAPVSQTTAATVFSCVASRNKRGMLAIRRIARAGRLPSGGPQRSQAHCEHSRASDTPKVSALSPHKAVKFDFSPFLSISGCALRGWAEGPARRPGDPAGRKNSAQACRVRPQPIAIRRSTHNPNLLISTCRSSQFKRVEACGA